MSGFEFSISAIDGAARTGIIKTPRGEIRTPAFMPVGTAATVGFLRYMWLNTPFRRVYLHTLSWNMRAQRCFGRAGFAPVARVLRGSDEFVRMDVRREWWQLWDQEGRFPHPEPPA